MEIKKNPKADLNRNSSLYFVIGLALVLFLTWRVLEHRTFESEQQIVQLLNVPDDLKEEVPLTKTIRTPPPPPPPSVPELIEIVEDEAEVEETIIESTEASQETLIQEVVEVDDLEVAEIEEEIIVPFAVIENVPVYPGCETMKTNEERKACFQQMIQAHVRKEFKYPPVALELGIQGKVYVQFAIDRRGEITGIRTRGPDRNLEQEASRIVALLPKMSPGQQRGRAVKVPYSIPINFVLQQ